MTARRSRFSDVWLRDVRLLSVDLARARGWTRRSSAVRSPGSRRSARPCGGSSFTNANWTRSNFRGAQLADVTFEDCLLRDVDFAGATLKRAQFPRSTLARADFSRATLDQADLRGAELDITAGFESLRGAVVTTAQFLSLSPALARRLGVDLKDT